jgi:hypothetical protein
MNFEDRVKAVTEFGFTERQARFLVTVMLHSGVCVPRQYASFAGTAYGHKVTKFFDKLVQRSYATVCGCLHNRAELYHVKHNALYQTIGQPHSRYRRPVPARQAIARLMRLDSIVLFPELMYVATEDEKVAFFGVMAPSLPRERLPHITVGKGASQRVRLFPEDQAIGVTSSGRVVFTYVVSAGYIEEFRAFVQRHADLLQALPGWTLRALFPRQSASAMRDFEAAARYELTTPLRPDTLVELKWYFNKCRSTSNQRALSFEDEEFVRDQAAFSAPRFQQLYRRWLKDGDSVFEAVSSPAIAEALERGTGRIESHVLLLSYSHLSPLASLVRSAAKGVEEGDTSPAPPQPPPPPSLSISDQLTRDWYRSIGRT